MTKTLSKLQSDHEKLEEVCEGRRFDCGTTAMYEARHRERCNQIRWLLDQINMGVEQVEIMRDRAREVQPRVNLFNDNHQPVVEFLDDAIAQYDQIISSFGGFVGWRQ
ncbi:ABC transporter G family member 18-like protein [Corchorus olitorius]|uniref:ABC transporter G family member 18-like protein n=1 Tax=Corchorus olitorius TaxID=93759 RepID=A0A1R3KYM9_9ROSI|nr:ABC transporter G family member 18-like protein [Corchorus olitorius]